MTCLNWAGVPEPSLLVYAMRSGFFSMVLTSPRLQME